MKEIEMPESEFVTEKDFDDAMEIVSDDFAVLDWKEASDAALEAFDNLVSDFGLEVVLYYDGSDSYIFGLAKRNKKTEIEKFVSKVEKRIKKEEAEVLKIMAKTVKPVFKNKTIKVRVCPKCKSELEKVTNEDAMTMFTWKCPKCSYKI